jgi:hypothetical protein
VEVGGGGGGGGIGVASSGTEFFTISFISFFSRALLCLFVLSVVTGAWFCSYCCCFCSFFFFLARILDIFDFDFCDFLVHGFGICVSDCFFQFFFLPHLHFVCFLAVEWKKIGLLTICFLEREEGKGFLLLLKNRYRIVSGSLHS